MLIFCAILAAIVMTTMNNTPFKFNIMHLFHLEFGEKRPEITGKTLHKILDAVNHRPMLQEVRSARDKTPPKKERKWREKKVDAPKSIKNVNKTPPKKEEKLEDVKNKERLDKVQKTEDNSAGNND